MAASGSLNCQTQARSRHGQSGHPNARALREQHARRAAAASAYREAT